MDVLWDETTFGISMSNDILSLKKELQSDGILSAIPLRVCRGIPIQAAVGEAMVELQESIDRMNVGAKKIILDALPEDKEKITAYVDVMKTNQTGHHYWSIRSGRYYIVGTVQEDGSIDIEL